ncbi:MAG: TonB-dependent receptor [Planctomycetes bacterium]|nr:TonB-dependent receptor [Planctomycetota bacterium]
MAPARLLGSLATPFLALSLTAQDPQDPGRPGRPDPQEPRPAQEPAKTARPVVVTATRNPKDPFEVPQSTTTLSGATIVNERQARTAPEALREVPGVSVQKTAHGQGSPKIRGQTGFQTLLLVDGVRINDSTWRSGNVEYWGHLDPFSFERFELVRGPGAVLWGSDAAFGVGQVISKGRDSFAPGVHADGMAVVRGASAEQSFTGHAESNGNADGFGWHLGTSYKWYDDLAAGRDVGVMPVTGNYAQIDLDARFTWQLDAASRLTLAAQGNDLDDVPRTHNTIYNTRWRGLTAGTDLLRQNDHRRQLYYARFDAEDQGGLWDAVSTTLAYKNRYERQERVPANGRLQVDALTVETLGVVLQARKETGAGTWTLGADWYHDWVASDFREFNPDGSLRSRRNRGVVAGDADYDLAGVFVQDEIGLGERFDVTLGVRYTYAAQEARDVDVPGDSVVFDDIDEEYGALTGSARGIYELAPEWRLFGGYAQGFRAPNLSDTTRFDVGRSGEQEVPAQGLDPEYYDTFELGARFDDGRYAFELTPWYTLVRDQILRRRTGNLVNGIPEVSKANVGDGYLYGIEVQASARLTALELDEWTVFGWVDWVHGRIDQYDNQNRLIRDDVANLPPVTGLLGLRWEHPARTTGAEVVCRMAAAIDSDDYTEQERGNPTRIPPDGLPGYAVISLRGWHRLNPHLLASLAIENANDLDYRIMDSGVMEPGTNVVFTMQADF